MKSLIFLFRNKLILILILILILNLDIANGFNNFFVSIGPKLANNLKSDIDPLSYVNNNINSIVVQEVSCSQVREVINSLNNSSPGHDELPPLSMH